MKYLKLFESFEKDSMDSICKEFGIRNYSINSDGTIDVDGEVDISSLNIEKMPLRFGRVNGNFNCSGNFLKSLEGSPKEVGGSFCCDNNDLITLVGAPNIVGVSFLCSNNQLITLEGCPVKVDWSFDCSTNDLTSLKGAPSHVGGWFDCSNNLLTSLEGCPTEVGRGFFCNDNQLTSLKGAPKFMEDAFNCENNNLINLDDSPIEITAGGFWCYGNPIHNIYQLFPNYKSFKLSLDYGYLRGTDIVKWRLEEAIDELSSKEIPNEIEGYNWI